MRYMKWSFLADDTVFVPRGRVHIQISYIAEDLDMVVPYERGAKVRNTYLHRSIFSYGEQNIMNYLYSLEY